MAQPLNLVIEAFPYFFSVCKIADPRLIDWRDPFVFVGKTDAELSLVCREASVPEGSRPVSAGWRMFRVAGQLDFSLAGILSRISGVLADEQIPIFAVSTYDTDYVLVKNSRFARALKALESAGCRVKHVAAATPRE